jgi:hypothetical protein
MARFMREATARLIVAILSVVWTAGIRADEKELIPPQLPREQRDNLLRFLRQHEKPDRFIPADAKFVGPESSVTTVRPEKKPAQAIKQYMVQITAHRPVPGQDEDKQVDVYYYRPNPEKGKPGITVKHTVDLTNGKQVGPTEVLLNHHTALSRDELNEAVELAKEKSPAVKDLYANGDKDTVHWEYLQLFVSRKRGPHEPGDRVVRFVFTGSTANGGAGPARIPVVVNLTKGIVAPEAR